MNGKSLKAEAVKLFTEFLVVLMAISAIVGLANTVCSVIYTCENAEVINEMSELLSDPSLPAYDVNEVVTQINEITSRLKYEWLNYIGSAFSLFFTVSLSNVFLVLVRTKKVAFSDFVVNFNLFIKGLAISLIETVAIAVGLLLFIVPGVFVIAAYSQAVNILIDHPDYSIVTCLSESRKAMNGFKADYITLILSFIGWAFLSLIVQSIVSSLIDALGSGAVITFLSSFAAMLIGTIVTIYVNTTTALYYVRVISPRTNGPESVIEEEEPSVDDTPIDVFEL